MNDDPQTADDCVIEKLDELATVLEVSQDMDVLGYIGPLLGGCDDFVREIVESRRSRRRHLLVMLQTFGGYIEPVRRIVAVFRKHYKRVEFVVPDYAMSAGTVLVMSGDAIHMDYYATLGPIDPQIESSQGNPISALGYLVQFDRLLKKANAGKASSAEMAMLLQFDLGDLYSYEQNTELSIQLLEEWLVKYKFKDWKLTQTKKIPVTLKMKRDRARRIGEILNNTEKWHTHGTGITIEVLRRDLKLQIDDFGKNPQLSEPIKSYHRLMVNYMHRRGWDVFVHRPKKYIGS